jgi:hypothetical protein
MRMKVSEKPPKKIYIQWYGDQKPSEYEGKPFLREVTWAPERIFQHDVVYVRPARRPR